MSEISKLNQSFASKKIDNETLNVQIFKNDILMALVGEFNSNLLLKIQGKNLGKCRATILAAADFQNTLIPQD